MTPRPKRANAPAGGSPLPNAIAFGETCIGWRFDYMDNEQWPFPAARDGGHPAFWSSLHRIGGAPYAAWDNPAHIEPFENLSQAGRTRLEELGLREVVERRGLARFPVTEIAGHARMRAIKNDNVYFLLWWDPDHEVERAAPSRRLRRKLRDRR